MKAIYNKVYILHYNLVKSLKNEFNFTIIVSDGSNVYEIKYNQSTRLSIRKLSSNLYYFTYRNIEKKPSDNLMRIWSLILNKIEGCNNKSKKLLDIIGNKIFDEQRNTYNVIINIDDTINYYYYTLHKMVIMVIYNFILTNIIQESSTVLIHKSKPITMNIVTPPICAYNIFAKYSREYVIKKYYNGNSQDKNGINKMIGKLWKKMSSYDKQEYKL